jgi:hypothetical protein
MKLIIDGKRYDTDTAECIHEWSNAYPSSDFHHRTKSLYRTKNGNWFMWHEGGALTDMAESAGQNCWTGGQSLEPMNEADVRAFLETHDGTKALEEWFPEQIQDA